MFTKVGAFLILTGIVTMGCSNQVNFAGERNSDSLPGIEIPSVTPVTPVAPPVEPPSVLPQPDLIMKTGTCSVAGASLRLISQHLQFYLEKPRNF